MKCKVCRNNVDPLMATFWNGQRWHRSCAVKYQRSVIDKLEKKLSSSGISQIKYLELQKDLVEEKEDLKCLIQTELEEQSDLQKLGSILVRRGFGKNVDTHSLLESGKITKKMISHSEDIKQLYEVEIIGKKEFDDKPKENLA